MILASQSPRRRELIQLLKQKVDFQSSNVDESLVIETCKKEGKTSPEELVMALSAAKAADVAGSHPGNLVIGADTIVVLDDEILGKPKDKEEARLFLHRLCGREHLVLTAVTLQKDHKSHSFVETSRVEFFELSKESENFIESYLESGAPMDKAGAYGIQDEGALLVKGIHGDFYNVMGLPIARLWRELQAFNSGKTI